MAKWLKVDAVLRSVKGEETRERLGMTDLDVETLIKPINIDLLRVESYAQALDEDGEEVVDETEIIMYSGLSITLKIRYTVFDRKIQE